jgi:hypothetical protein
LTDEERLAHFDTLGENKMRDYAREAPPAIQPLVYKWLERVDARKKREMDAILQEQLTVAKASERYARIAANAAVITVPLAIIAIVVTLCAWLLPLHQ